MIWFSRGKLKIQRNFLWKVVFIHKKKPAYLYSPNIEYGSIPAHVIAFIQFFKKRTTHFSSAYLQNWISNSKFPKDFDNLFAAIAQ